MRTVTLIGSRRGRLTLGLSLLALSIGLQPLPASAQPFTAVPRDTKSFWISGMAGWRYVSATFLGSDSQIRLYGADGASVSSASARRIVDVVERHILPTDLHLFGVPREMGTIDLLLLPMSGTTLGYFDETDLVAPRAPGMDVHSNNANVLYLRPPQTMPDTDKMSDFYEVVAHELQHLLDFRLRVLDRHLQRQAIWLDEGLSFYAQLANGYWTPRDRLKVLAAANNPWWQLPSMNVMDVAFAHYARVAYGRAGLFVTYLAATYGPTFVRSLLVAPSTGMRAVDRQLRRRGSDVRQVFAEWAVALYLNKGANGTFARLLHGFQFSPHLARKTVTVTTAGSQYSNSRGIRLQPWGNGYLRFETTTFGYLRLTAQSSFDRLRAAIVLQNSDHAQSSRVYWMRRHGRDVLMANATDFGRKYNRATVVLSDVTSAFGRCQPLGSDTVEVTALLSPANPKASVGGSVGSHSRGGTQWVSSSRARRGLAMPCGD
ncbi:MAG: hypothetical protein ACR2JC_19260 [Chloroflexota bacterium]